MSSSPDRARSLRADARRNRERLLACARTVFTVDGVDGASFNEIARQAGVGPATLYRHFPRREDLVAAVVGENLAGLTELGVRLLAEEPDPGVALRHWTAGLARHVSELRGLAEEMTHAVREPDSPLGRQCRDVLAVAERLVSAARAAGRTDPALTTTELVELVAALARDDGRTDDPVARAVRRLELATAGLLW